MACNNSFPWLITTIFFYVKSLSDVQTQKAAYYNQIKRLYRKRAEIKRLI